MKPTAYFLKVCFFFFFSKSSPLEAETKKKFLKIYNWLIKDHSSVTWLFVVAEMKNRFRAICHSCALLAMLLYQVSQLT